MGCVLLPPKVSLFYFELMRLELLRVEVGKLNEGHAIIYYPLGTCFRVFSERVIWEVKHIAAIKIPRFMTPQVLDRNELANGNGIYQRYPFPISREANKYKKLKKILSRFEI